MCGFVGISSKNALTDRNWLSEGCNQMFHRGPDDSGEWWSEDNRTGLAHRRLAILDLSPQGHQPMHRPDLRLSIVFNGEIYNYKDIRTELVSLGYSFVSDSDTEVLLVAFAAWGEDCIDKFNGMFSFSIFDSLRNRLFFARDRAGEKPLYYRFSNGCLQFASELKALLANPTNPRRVDREAMDCYLAMGYVPGELCILQGYKKLPPAHAMRFDLQSGQLDVWRYWQLPECGYNVHTLNECDLLEELEVILEDSVRKQMAADVPVGILLSGGVDSSLVTAMAVRASSQVQTFTVGFPGHGKLDETNHARLIARHFGTRHTELMAESVSADLLTRLAKQFDEPMVDSSMIPTFLVSQLVRRHCTVVLGGDGGDELFGGYPHYCRLQWLQQKFGSIPLFLRQAISQAAEGFLPVGFKGRNWAQALGGDLKKSLPMIALCFDAKTRQRLLRSLNNWPLVAESVWKERVPENYDMLQRATRMDFSNYLAEDILVKVDRASMLSSLEMRAPLLDYRLIEFAFSKVPSHLKATETHKKVLLKRLVSRILPPEFDQKRKQGFSVPLSEWLKGGDFGKLFNDVLRDSQCSFDAKTVDALLYGQSNGRNNSERLFSLVMFELWRREYEILI